MEGRRAHASGTAALDWCAPTPTLSAPILHPSCTLPAPLLQVRVFRVFKMGKSFAGLQLMVSALRASRQVRWAPSAPSPGLSAPLAPSAPPLAPSASSAPPAPSALLPRAPAPPPLCTTAPPRLDSAPLHASAPAPRLRTHARRVRTHAVHARRSSASLAFSWASR